MWKFDLVNDGFVKKKKVFYKCFKWFRIFFLIVLIILLKFFDLFVVCLYYDLYLLFVSINNVIVVFFVKIRDGEKWKFVIFF